MSAPNIPLWEPGQARGVDPVKVPFAASKHSLVLGDCARLLTVDLSGVGADESICMAAFLDYTVPVSNKNEKKKL